jgi:hypothetical protein
MFNNFIERGEGDWQEKTASSRKRKLIGEEIFLKERNLRNNERK